MTNPKEAFDKLEERFTMMAEATDEREEMDLKAQIMATIRMLQLQAYKEGLERGAVICGEVMNEMNGMKP